MKFPVINKQFLSPTIFLLIPLDSLCVYCRKRRRRYWNVMRGLVSQTVPIRDVSDFDSVHKEDEEKKGKWWGKKTMIRA